MSEGFSRRLAVMMLDMRSAENVDDEKIEALVQSLLTRGLKQGKARDLTFEEVGCAYLEATARILCSPLIADSIAAGHLSGGAETIAARMGENLAQRMIDRAKGRLPGEDEIGETKGRA